MLTGKASVGGLPVGVWDARLQWSGAFGPGGGTYRLSIVDPLTGMSLASATILGRESVLRRIARTRALE